MSHTDTKDRILDVAERLFAEQGFANTPLRKITAQAGANLAAVNYHFQSKDALIQAVFARRLGPLNQARLEMLDAAEARAGSGPLEPEEVLRAFFEPMLRWGAPCANNPHFARLLGRMYVEPGELFEDIFRNQFREVRDRFFRAAQRALPELPKEEIFWRMHFLIGALAHTMAGFRHIRAASEGILEPGSPNGVLEQLLAFAAAGFRAPSVTAVRRGEHL